MARGKLETAEEALTALLRHQTRSVLNWMQQAPVSEWDEWSLGEAAARLASVAQSLRMQRRSRRRQRVQAPSSLHGQVTLTLEEAIAFAELALGLGDAARTGSRGPADEGGGSP